MAKPGYVPKVSSKKAIAQYRTYLDQLKGSDPVAVQVQQAGVVHDMNEAQQIPTSDALVKVQDILSPHARSALDRILGKPRDCEEI